MRSERIYKHMATHPQATFTSNDIAKIFNISKQQASGALNWLQKKGGITVDSIDRVGFMNHRQYNYRYLKPISFIGRGGPRQKAKKTKVKTAQNPKRVVVSVDRSHNNTAVHLPLEFIRENDIKTGDLIEFELKRVGKTGIVWRD